MARRFAAALSEHPVTAHAVGEVAGQVLDAVGAAPDLVTALRHPAPRRRAGGRRRRRAADPRAPASARLRRGVGGGRRRARWRRRPAVVAVGGPRGPGRAGAGSLDAEGTDVRAGPRSRRSSPAPSLLARRPVLVPDADAFFARLAADHPGLPVIGGNASAARGPGRQPPGARRPGRSPTARSVRCSGPAVEVAPVVSPGMPARSASPTSSPAPSATWSTSSAASPPTSGSSTWPAARSTRRTSGCVNQRPAPGPGHRRAQGRLRAGRLPRPQRASAPTASNGAIAVNDVVDVGTTVQYHVRDAVTADEDLRELLAGRDAEAALVFTCNGRGIAPFGTPAPRRRRRGRGARRARRRRVLRRRRVRPGRRPQLRPRLHRSRSRCSGPPTG